MFAKSSVAAVLVLGLSGCGEDSPEKQSFVTSCSGAIQSLDCGCFYDAVSDVMTPDVQPKIISFLRSKKNYSAKQTKAKLQQIVGSNVTTYWRASVNCPK